MTTETTTSTTEVVTEVVTEVKNKPGRPSNPDSVRQKKLAEMSARAEQNGGEIKLGRPANPESARQKKLAEMSARAEANGGIKLGRPVDPESPRQQKLREIEERKAAFGGTLPKGRPKGTGRNQLAQAVQAEVVEPVTEEVAMPEEVLAEQAEVVETKPAKKSRKNK
jgi:hypothetical protein